MTVLAASVVLSSSVFGVDFSGKGIFKYSQNGASTDGDKFAPSALLMIEEELSDGNTVSALLQDQAMVNETDIEIQAISLTSTSLLPFVTTTIGRFQTKQNTVSNAFKGYQDIIDTRSYKTGVSIGFNELELVDVFVNVDNGMLDGNDNNTNSNMNLTYGASLKGIDNLVVIAQLEAETYNTSDDKLEETIAFVGYDLEIARIAANIYNAKNWGSVGTDYDTMGLFAAYELSDDTEVFATYLSTKTKVGGTTTDGTETSVGVSRTIGSVRAVATYTQTTGDNVADSTTVTAGVEYNF